MFLRKESFDFRYLKFASLTDNLVELLTKNEIFGCSLKQFRVELQLFGIRLHLYIQKVSHYLPLMFQLLDFRVYNVGSLDIVGRFFNLLQQVLIDVAIIFIQVINSLLSKLYVISLLPFYLIYQSQVFAQF